MVHSYQARCQKALAAYQRLAERKLVRLRDFEFPQLVDCDEQWHILELSIVGSPQFSDFVEVGREKKRQTSFWTALEPVGLLNCRSHPRTRLCCCFGGVFLYLSLRANLLMSFASEL